MAREKGKPLMIAVVMVMVIAVVGLFYFGAKLSQQSAVASEPGEVKATAEAVGSGLKQGDAATLKLTAYDQESNTQAQVAANYSVEEWSGDKVGEGTLNLLSDSAALSATASTSVATTIGANLRACIVNDATYYGECKDIKVTKSTQPETLNANTITDSIKIQCYDNGVVLSTCNLTLAADQSDSLDYIRIEQNKSNSAFNFKMLVFNVTSGSNVNNIEASGAISLEGLVGSGTLQSTNTVPTRLRTTADFLFEVAEPIMLHEFDVLKTPPVTMEASGSDPNEFINFLIVDSANFKSVKSATQKRILSGVETDASSAVDVGASDFRTNMHIS